MQVQIWKKQSTLSIFIIFISKRRIQQKFDKKKNM